MPSPIPIIVFVLTVIGSFLMHVIGAVVLTMMIGTTIFMVLCFLKGFCITSTLSWVALEFIFFISGVAIGVYNFSES